jgi:hypothetical protein
MFNVYKHYQYLLLNFPIQFLQLYFFMIVLSPYEMYYLQYLSSDIFLMIYEQISQHICQMDYQKKNYSFCIITFILSTMSMQIND